MLNATDDGLTVSCDCAAVPDPLRLIFNGEPGALLVTEMLPVALPVAVGENVTVKEVVPFGLRVPAVKPPIENPVSEAVAAETITGAVPEFVSVTFTEPLPPTSTLPKLMLEEFAESEP